MTFINGFLDKTKKMDNDNRDGQLFVLMDIDNAVMDNDN